MKTKLARALAFLVAGGVGAAGPACSGATSGDADAGDVCFEAFQADLTDFRAWTSYSYDVDAAIAGNVHFTGPRTEWIRKTPPHGSTAFPVGTLIVKEIYGVDQDSHHIFAMAKRGCGFNAGGAAGWEFFELSEGLDDRQPLTILWRGTAPPAGETYAGNSGCNVCHAACTDNDSVCSPNIRLSAY
jgi:hypothetical protein